MRLFKDLSLHTCAVFPHLQLGKILAHSCAIRSHIRLPPM